MVKKYHIVGTNMSFGQAFDWLKEQTMINGKANTAIRLSQWKEDVCIRIQNPTDDSNMTAPFLYVDSRFGKVPWKETMIELFSNKWMLIDIIEEGEPDEDKQYPNEECSEKCLKKCIGECKK